MTERSHVSAGPRPFFCNAIPTTATPRDSPGGSRHIAAGRRGRGSLEEIYRDVLARVQMPWDPLTRENPDEADPQTLSDSLLFYAVGRGICPNGNQAAGLGGCLGGGAADSRAAKLAAAQSLTGCHDAADFSSGDRPGQRCACVCPMPSEASRSTSARSILPAPFHQAPLRLPPARMSR